MCFYFTESCVINYLLELDIWRNHLVKEITHTSETEFAVIMTTHYQ